MENEELNMDDIVEEVIENEDDEPVVIKKRRPKFTKEDMERRKKQAN